MKKLANRMLSIGLISAMLALTTACNSVQSLSYVRRFEPVIVNVLVLACAINTGLPVCGGMQTRIKADADLVIKLWGDYNTAIAAGTSTVAAWNALNAAFTVFSNDSADIFAAASGLNAPQVTAIVASAQILLAAIEALFPAPPSGVAVAGPKKFAAYRLGAGNYDKAWFDSWKKDYNQKVDTTRKLYPGAKLKKI